jgi:hypothetical protein
MGWALRVRDDADGFYARMRGRVLGKRWYIFTSRDEAEEVRRAMMNGAEFEVVEVAVNDIRYASWCDDCEETIDSW